MSRHHVFRALRLLTLATLVATAAALLMHAGCAGSMVEVCGTVTHESNAGTVCVHVNRQALKAPANPVRP